MDKRIFSALFIVCMVFTAPVSTFAQNTAAAFTASAETMAVPYALIFYLLFLVYAIIYYARVINKSYQQGLHFGEGQDKIHSFLVLVGILAGQFVISSVILRLILIVLFGFALFLIYRQVGIHNKANHSGELFLFYHKEVQRSKMYCYIGIGIALLTIVVILIGTYLAA